MTLQKHTTQITILATSLFLLFGCTETQTPAKEHTDKTQLTVTNGTPLPDSETRIAEQHKKRDREEKAKQMTGQVISDTLSSTPKALASLPYIAQEGDIASAPRAVVAKSMHLEKENHGYIPPAMNTESYTPVGENRFISVTNDPLSTFSIDVDTASYANIRRLINDGNLPPVGAVRVEEMINYFTYNYPQPNKGPFAISAEVGPSPWQPKHKLVKIGLKAKELEAKDIPASNLVFLIDVSGSMNAPDKLPLLKQSMMMLVEQLGIHDRVAIVVYAGSDRVVLPPTPGDQKEKIHQAIKNLNSGGSTHGSSGIKKAYSLAEQTFMPKGNNRIILASDGDFNVGTTSRGELQKLIEVKRKTGVYLTVLGFGMGNYHDDTMEILADSGNGNYAYIDSLLEAKKVLLKERASTLFTLAKDVKIQVEFNPQHVGAYRLIGYENRMLADEDFKDDTKDAGEVGVGHTVTALYEIIPAKVSGVPEVDPLKYQETKNQVSHSNELMNLKLRYKPLGQETSKMTDLAVKNISPALENTSDDFRFTAAVAGFGMVLKDSSYSKTINYSELLSLAKSGRGKDDEGYRAEFIRLVEIAQLL